ncbi:hypothetical protein [Paracoccus marcusii]|uniref:hypothetical protein n=1 Tax=Paracoccus marcusii TaxID=59779 RepID=UPI001C3CA537|nr:hypothetical protein [Paracoccus marcusii]
MQYSNALRIMADEGIFEAIMLPGVLMLTLTRHCDGRYFFPEIRNRKLLSGNKVVQSA